MGVVRRQLSIKCPECGIRTVISYKARIQGEDYTFETDHDECPNCDVDWNDTVESLVEEDIEDHFSCSIDKELEQERHKQFVEALENWYEDD
jgi:rRNA maturation protein Nop10